MKKRVREALQETYGRGSSEALAAIKDFERMSAEATLTDKVLAVFDSRHISKPTKRLIIQILLDIQHPKVNTQ